MGADKVRAPDVPGVFMAKCDHVRTYARSLFGLLPASKFM